MSQTKLLIFLVAVISTTSGKRNLIIFSFQNDTALKDETTACHLKGIMQGLRGKVYASNLMCPVDSPSAVNRVEILLESPDPHIIGGSAGAKVERHVGGSNVTVNVWVDQTDKLSYEVHVYEGKLKLEE